MRLSLLLALILIAFRLNAGNLIPLPASVVNGKGFFKFEKTLSTDATLKDVPCLNLLKSYLLEDLNVSLTTTGHSKAQITFRNDGTLKEEAYELSVSPTCIIIKASGDKGYLYAVESLRQLVEKQNGKNVIACVRINDEPRSAWREFMLDSGRQYQKVSTIKKYLDMMAMLKMNVFHWHLTEGLGWRLEIKKYPKLTAVGSNVAKEPEQQGYYSQEDVKEIVRYAGERHIMVVPEIDMPGHAEAAIISYPWTSCFGKAPEARMSFGPTIFCAGKDSVVDFLKNILTEVCDLFPAPYVHLGGDEAPKQNWDSCQDCQNKIKAHGLKNSNDLQRYFSAEMANFLKTRNKKAIFWDDVVLSDGYPLPENVVIQWWNFRRYKTRGLEAAISHGYPVICGTNYATYLNFPVVPWAGYAKNRTFDIRECYEKNPSQAQLDNPHVLGMSCCMWCDYNIKESMIDQRLFPRILSLSEQMWHKGTPMPFDDFYSIVKSKKPWMESKGYVFGPGLAEEISDGYKWD